MYTTNQSSKLSTGSEYGPQYTVSDYSEDVLIYTYTRIRTHT